MWGGWEEGLHCHLDRVKGGSGGLMTQGTARNQGNCLFPLCLVSVSTHGPRHQPASYSIPINMGARRDSLFRVSFGQYIWEHRWSVCLAILMANQSQLIQQRALYCIRLRIVGRELYPRDSTCMRQSGPTWNKSSWVSISPKSTTQNPRF